MQFSVAGSASCTCLSLFDGLAIHPTEAALIRSFRNRSLQKFWERGEVRSIPTDWTDKIEMVLDLLDKARAPEDVALPGLFYGYPEGTKGRFAVKISKSWRLTFGWKNGEAVDVDLDELH